MTCENNWINILTALLVPAIALFGVFIAYMQWHTNELKRKQDLFDKRYSFYKKAREAYIAASSEQYRNTCDITDFFNLAEEAHFLFGVEVAKHIISIGDRNIPEQVNYGIIDNWFITPFEKYLELK